MKDLTSFFRPFILSLLRKWVEISVQDTGLLRPSFSRTWEPDETFLCTPVTQSRLLYNFSCGYRLTGETVYRDAVNKGADCLVSCFWDASEGGWFTSVSPDGTAVDLRKDSYHHAFALLGLSHAFGLSGKTKYLDYALKTLDIMENRFRDGSGGYRRHMTRDFKSLETLRSQNPVMHFFEALLALSAVQKDGPGPEKARETAEFIFTVCFNSEKKCLPEFYSETWSHTPPSRKGHVDTGHQCEWAFLVSEAGCTGIDEKYISRGHELINFAVKYGFDTEYGGIFSPCTPDGNIIKRRKGWWEQCEAVRALHRYCTVHERDDLITYRDSCAAFLIEYLIDPEYGGLYSSISSRNEPEDTAKGTLWKTDYHTAGMCMELIQQH